MTDARGHGSEFDRLHAEALADASAQPTGIAGGFIARLFGPVSEERVYISSLPNGKDEPDEDGERHVMTREIPEIDDFVEKWDRPKRALYFCVATVRPGAKRRAKNTIAEIIVAHADIDFKDIAQSPAEIGARVKELRLPPSVVVVSGHGLHLYWRLREAIAATPETIEQVEAVLRLLCEHVGGDRSCCEASRLMRLPGSHNSKFGEWNAVTVLIERESCRYELDEIEEWLAETAPIIRRKDAPAAPDNPWLAVAARFGIKPPIDVEQRLAAMRYGGAGEASVHQTQISVTAALLNRGHALEEVVATVLEATRAAAGEHGERWNWRREEQAVRKMCAAWLAKHPEIEEREASPMEARGPSAQPDAAEQATGTDGPVTSLATERAKRKSKADGGVLTEHIAALAFAERCRGQLLFDHGRRAWFEWAGSHWKLEQTELARDLVRDTVTRLATAAGKSTFVSGVERLARADRAFAVRSDFWDGDPFLLGTPGGTVDLRTGELRSADPADHISKVTAVAPAAESDCLRWRRFLFEATCGDAGMVRFLQQWAGYSLTGDVREHTLVFIHGDGGNGKGVWVNTVAHVMKDYAATAAMTTFTAGIFDQHPTEVAMLAGARMVTATETEENHAWAEARIKSMTGGDPITAHFMRQDNFTYTPTFKLTVVGNHKPALKNIDDAMKRRLRIVPFTHKPKVVNPQLKEDLRKEWPAILRWMIEGCLDWQKNGLTATAAIAAATDEYFREQDLVGEWLEKYDVEPGNEYKTSVPAALYESWRDFADKAGFPPGSQRTLADKLKSKGLRNGKSNGVRHWYGIQIKAAQDAGSRC